MSEYAKREAINRLVDRAVILEAKSGANTAATALELNTLYGVPVTLTTAATPATGSNAAQFVFKDAAGAAITGIHSGVCYVTKDAAGASSFAAVTGAATLTNGELFEIGTKQVYNFITDAAGKLGVTLTSTADTYYMAFVFPNGKVITSSALVIN
jgi:4-hydroxybenzoate polyprenyltransferase